MKFRETHAYIMYHAAEQCITMIKKYIHKCQVHIKITFIYNALWVH